MALTARVALKVNLEQTNVLDLATGTFNPVVSYLDTLASGTAADQADVLFTDTRSLASAGTEDLDFAGVLAGAFGATATFAKVKMIVFIADGANTTRLTISRPASNGLVIFGAASGALASLGANGVFFVYDPGTTGVCAVTAATGDLLTITNGSGATATYKVVLLGTSA